MSDSGLRPIKYRRRRGEVLRDKTLKDIKSPYAKLKYLEKKYPEREISARAWAYDQGISYIGNTLSFYNPKTHRTTTISKSRRLKYVRRAIKLITGEYQANKEIKYAENMAKKVQVYADEDLFNAFDKAMRGPHRSEILREIQDINMFYVTYEATTKRTSRGRRVSLDLTNEVDKKIIDSNLSDLRDVLTKYGYIE